MKAKKKPMEQLNAKDLGLDLTNRIHLGLLLKGIHIGRVPMSFCLSTPTQDSDIQTVLDKLTEVLNET